MPSRSISSSNLSGVHLIDIPPEMESAPVTQNILAPTQKHRSAPHFMSSVAPGNDRQNVLSCSIFISICLRFVLTAFSVLPLDRSDNWAHPTIFLGIRERNSIDSDQDVFILGLFGLERGLTHLCDLIVTNLRRRKHTSFI